jgi:cobalt-zinc-cadmium efflux system membrane fusion protein
MIRGIITSLNPGLDEETRSFVVNIIIPTQNGWPKVGENLRLEIQSSTPQQSLLIPVAALTYDGDKAVVFVKKSDAVFEKRIIQINEFREQMVVVDSGLANGEEIAVSNVFSLKALSRFDIISE